MHRVDARQLLQLCDAIAAAAIILDDPADTARRQERVLDSGPAAGLLTTLIGGLAVVAYALRQPCATGARTVTASLMRELEKSA